MTENSYFNHQPIPRFTVADATRLNSIFNAISEGFGKLPSAEEINQGSRNFSIATGPANSYSVTVSFPVNGYVAGLRVRALIMIANTGASSLNVNSIGPATIKRADNTTLLPGDLRANSLNDFTFDGTAFRLTSFHGASEAITSANAATSTLAASQAAASAASAGASASSAAASQVTATSAASTAEAALNNTRFGTRNVILNPLFWLTNPLGSVFSGTYAAGTLIRDRWRAGSSGVTFSILSYTMTITAGSIQQVVQGRNMLQSGPYTLSWDGTAPATVNGAAISNGGSVYLPGALTTTISWGVGTLHHPQFEFSPTKTQFDIKPTDLEISLCAQYYQKSYEMGTAPGTPDQPGFHVSLASTAQNLSQGFVQFSTPMRGPPVVKIYSQLTGGQGNVYVTTPNWDVPATVAIPSFRGFHVASPEGYFTAGSFIDFHWTADAEL